MGRSITLKEYEFCGLTKRELPARHADAKETITGIREELLMMVAASPVPTDAEGLQEILSGLRLAVLELLRGYEEACLSLDVCERALEDLDNVEESY